MAYFTVAYTCWSILARDSGKKVLKVQTGFLNSQAIPTTYLIKVDSWLFGLWTPLNQNKICISLYQIFE